MSATIGMLAAVREPARFARLIHVGPSPYYLNDLPGYAGGFERDDLLGLMEMMQKNYRGRAGALAPVIVGNPDRAEHAAELEASFCATDPVMAYRFAEATLLSDYRCAVPHVPVPSLILQCAQDAIAPEAVGRWVHRYLPHSTHLAMQATGHCPNLTHPDETSAAICACLDTPLDSSVYEHDLARA